MCYEKFSVPSRGQEEDGRDFYPGLIRFWVQLENLIVLKDRLKLVTFWNAITNTFYVIGEK